MNSSDDFLKLEALFHELEVLVDEARAERLAEISAEDPGLAAELARMLEPSPSLARDEQALDQVASGGGLASSFSDDDPSEIGAYRLIRKLGQGGMGRVYLAEQSEPVQREVALKLTRRGFDSVEAKARFKAERQALAVLEHPHIAQVFDAGSTDDGRPWFAMEYIEGVSITQWAAERRLNLRERIELLLPVCDAIQHAHRKGLIHRDLKPSNILVVDNGARGYAKVIDFGIARAVDLGLDEGSQLTQLGELVGTPEYMSPEQAALGSVDIDTRSDVYSLGLVLYELLVGQLPMTGKALRALGFEAMCREIREGDTPKPSRYQNATSTSTTTPTDPETGRWRSQLKGDLDSVLLKALAKDRERRYGSASELADDLKRYLDNQPVQAQPPSLSYRASKFVRRNRILVSAGAMVALALVAATAISAIGLVQARQAEERAQASAEQARLDAERATAAQLEAESQYELANAYLLGQRVYSDLLLEQFAGEDGGQQLTDTLMERWREQHANWEESEDNATALSLALGRNFYFRRDYPRAHEIFEAWLSAGYGPDTMRAAGRELYASSLFDAGRRDEALPLLRELLAEMESGMRRSAVDRFNVALRIAVQSRDAADLTVAEALYAQRDEEFGVTSPNPAQRIENLGGLMTIRRLQGDLSGSADVLEDMTQVYVDHPDFSFGRNIVHSRLAELWLFDQARAEAAEQLARKVITEDVERLGENQITARGGYLLARALLHQGQLDAAEQALESAATVYARHSESESLPPEYQVTQVLLALGRDDLAQAERELELLREQIAALPSGPPWPETLALVEIYYELKSELQSQPDAAELRDRLPPRPAVDLEAIYLHDRIDELLTTIEQAG